MGVPLPLADAGAPAGQKGQRGTLLTQLKRAQPLTARALAVRLGVSLNAVRHHLKELEAEGLVGYEREHRGVGAPAFSYRLTPAGEALFPRRYEEALSAMLEAVVERDGRAAAVAMLEAYFSAQARRMKAELEKAPEAERWAHVVRLLSAEGYMAEVRRPDGEAGTAELIEHNCPIRAVAERFPEICAAEARHLADALSAEVERTGHILNGCPACEYKVRLGRAAEESR